ncbi:MAG: truA 1 [Acidobacteria bacterium]|nr:truA 1 [Acidobacteriota bacterium]
MPTFKITVAYDGSDYVGWQRQANGVAIQALIEDALRDLDGRDVPVAGAGRTDAGVHALGQVAAFSIARPLGPDAIVRAINASMPPAIRVLAAEEVAPAFHPRFGARQKTYRYQLWNADVMSPFERAYAWHVPGPLDVEAMRAAARLLEGRHDFAAFQATGSSVSTTEREIFASRIADRGLRTAAESAIELPTQSAIRNPQSALLSYEVTGSGFLRHMVRIIVGSLVEVGRGRQPVDWIGAVIAGCDRTRAGPTAPPHGLFLVTVDYPGSLAAGS